MAGPMLLVAEADAELRDAYRAFLALHGFAVETASDGLECLAKLRRLAPDVLVLDQGLRWGGSDGVLACLRENTSGARVILTATAQPQALPEVVFHPVVKLLAKPFSLEALLGAVGEAAANKAPGGTGYVGPGGILPDYYLG
jgi:two-component system KDP operon response regulator KdpE